MPKYTYFSRQLVALSDKHTQTEIAEMTGLHQSALSKLISRGDRPAPQTLKKICSSLPNRRDGLDILISHLRDEVHRAGREQSEIDITPSDLADSDLFKILAAEAAVDTELKALLQKLANMCKTHPSTNILKNDEGP